MSLIGLVCGVLLRVVVGGNAVEESPVWRAAIHAAALVGSLVVVGDEVGVERRLHLLDGLKPGAPSFDAEVLVEQRGSAQRCRWTEAA
jgi:hypothetical protein